MIFFPNSVSRQFVVTAAHCIEQARMKDIIVFLGELDTQNSGKVYEPLPAQKHHVARKIIHPNFRFRIAQPDRYDLALLQLTIPTTYSYDIHLSICLVLFFFRNKLNKCGVHNLLYLLPAIIFNRSVYPHRILISLGVRVLLLVGVRRISTTPAILAPPSYKQQRCRL